MLKHLKFSFLVLFLFFLLPEKKLKSEINDISKVEILENRKINEIRLLGLNINPSNIITSNLTTQKGELFSLKKIQNDFRYLKELKIFKKIDLEYELGDQNTCILIFKFVEYPIIQKIEIIGNTEIESDEIKKLMELKEFYSFSDSSLRNDRLSIVELYQKKKFQNTHVNLEVHEKELTKVDIKVTINEGNPLYIKKIRIIGTKYLNPDLIYQQMETKESSFLFGKSILDPEKLNNDRFKIINYLKSNGHYYGKILSTKIKQEKFNTELGLSIIIEIEEGPRFNFSNIIFQGSKISIKDETKLRNLLPTTLQEGQIFNISLVGIYMSYMQNFFHNQSYLQVEIKPEFVVKEKNLSIDVIFNIYKGEKIYIEKIYIKNNEITKPHIIDQELEIFEGELFNANKVKNSLQNLQKLGFFKNVNIIFENKKHDHLSNLIFQVEEDPFGLLNFGASYNTEDNFGIHAQFNKKNLLGSGWNLQVDGKYDKNTIYLKAGTSVEWLVPYVPLSLDLRISFTQKKDLIYNLIRKDILKEDVEYSYYYRYISFSFIFGYPIVRNFHILTGYSFSFSQSYDTQNFSIDDLDNSKRSLYLKQDLENFTKTGKANFLSTITQMLIFKYDNIRTLSLGVKEGFSISTKWFYTGGIPYYGDSHWIKTENEIQAYYIPFWKIMLAARIRYASFFQQFTGEFKIREFDLIQFNPYTELRGWNQNNNEYTSSKGSLLSLSAEIHVPIFDPFLGAVGFFDAGDTNSETPSFPTQIYHFSFGFALKILLPMLPLTIYFPIRSDYNITKPNEFYIHEGIDIFVSISYQF